MDRLKLMAAIGITDQNLPTWMRNIEADASGKPEQMAAQAVMILLDRIEEWHAAVDSIDQTLFSEVGYQKEKAKLAATFKAELSELESGFLDQIFKNVASLQKAAMKDETPLTESQQSQLVYVWQQAPADALTLELIHADAVAEGDWLTAHALETLPLVHPARIDRRDSLPKDVLDSWKAKRIMAGVSNASQLQNLAAAKSDLEHLTGYLHEQFDGPAKPHILVGGERVMVSDSEPEAIAAE